MNTPMAFDEAAKNSKEINPNASFNKKFLEFKKKLAPEIQKEKEKPKKPRVVKPKIVSNVDFNMPEIEIVTETKLPTPMLVPQIINLDISLKDYELSRIISDIPTETEINNDTGPYSNQKLKNIILIIKNSMKLVDPVLAENIKDSGTRNELIKKIHNLIDMYNIPIGSEVRDILDFTSIIKYVRISDAVTKGPAGAYTAVELKEILSKIKAAIGKKFPDDIYSKKVTLTGTKKNLVDKIKDLIEKYNIKTS